MAISLRSGSEASVFDSGTTLTVNTTSGDLIIVQLRSSASNYVTSIADSVGTVYKRALQVFNLAVWYGVAAGTNASNVITPTYSGSPGFRGMLSAAWQSTIGWANVPTLHVMDASIDFGGADPTGPGMTTYIANALILGCGQRDGTGSAWSAGTGFTEVVEDGSNVQAMEFQVVSAVQTNVAFSFTQAGGGDALFLAFVETQSAVGGAHAHVFIGAL